MVTRERLAVVEVSIFSESVKDVSCDTEDDNDYDKNDDDYPHNCMTNDTTFGLRA